MQKDSKVIFNFRVIIHTVQMLSDEIETARLEEINNKPYIIKRNARPTKKGCYFPLNANKLYNIEIDSLTDFLTAITQIQADIGISEWVFNRIDFAFDSRLEYDKTYKYSLYLISLFSAITGIKNAIDIQDVNTKKRRAVMIKNSVFELQIYDKALESENKHPYSRFEFRFKNINSNDIYTIAGRLQRLLEDFTDGIQAVENQRINDLYDLWQRENNSECTTQAKNFSEFVRRYSNDIFTREIAKGLYHKINKGNFSSWLKWFRRNNKIDFITKSDVENIKTEMKKALNLYIEKG